MTGTPSQDSKGPDREVWVRRKLAAKLRSEEHKSHSRHASEGESADHARTQCHPEMLVCMCGGSGAKVTCLTPGSSGTAERLV